MRDVDIVPQNKMIGWATGSAGSTTILYVLNVILMYYMVTAMEIDPILAGSFLLAGRVYDGFADLIIGHFSDRTKSTMGRRRPWMAAGAILSGFGLGFLFSGIGGQIGLLIGLIVTFTGYSAYSIPSSAMPAEITQDSQMRTSLMAWRTFFIQIATLVGGALAPAVIDWGGSSQSAFATMGIAMAVFVTVTMLIAVVMTNGLQNGDPQTHEQADLATTAKLLKNKPFLVLLSVKFCAYIGAASLGAVGLFFMSDIMMRGEGGMAEFALASGVAGTITVPVWRAIAKLANKPTICGLAFGLSALTSISWYFASPTEGDLIFYLRGALTGFSATGGLLMTLSILPDTIAYGVKRSGLRKEGLYSAVYEFFQKAGFAIAPFVVGVTLQLSGYQSGVNVEQGAQALDAVRISMAVIPAGAQALGMILILLFYHLPEDDMAQPVAEGSA